MNEADINIVVAFRQLQRFCQQVQLLLSTADGLMANDDWNQAAGNIVFGDVSQALYKPEKWLPQYFCRFYTHEKKPTIIAFISIIIDETPDPKRVDQALVSAGWFDYAPPGPGNRWAYWYSKAHLWAAKRDDRGALCFADLAEWRRDLTAEVRQIASFAYPLSRVDDSTTLNHLIVRRLLDELAK